MKVNVTVTNENGLHARPAVLIAKRASEFNADIYLKANGKSATATNVLGIMGLGITCGVDVTIETSGDEEIAAAYTIAGMIAAKDVYR
ncbi:PTS sugar transporter subunit IIB [Megasphaera cerevisiae DSM 20462]|jgi:phosphocarrier protein|uniref:Phosphocarrier protein HPr n=1 Tax=Megasphaera cerevisiae DSM 20462 TaxID=1122219 RepID=A0A0J6WUX9_9FIRM|nr:HPr family phosphocarrier protein [Megasphaera cerevisiae]KMO86359.1 PTS sugar transporter subunit IIB [Megasphaera cerevisiae DSM 20462]MCI1750252.1 HPr family phosphocarrier protein [Megasphaera cerevisiae]OKY53240.1 PTS sugar transporter subunit IIB [Megasphaera cerevisiae]SJZ97847.1 phosphocarrier protein [Megasphaera cerevisiae DSM 20462]